MFRLVKITFLILSTTLLIERSFGFSLLGPISSDPSWQIPALGYDPLGGEAIGPKNLGEEYRWNKSTMTYGFDYTFVNYFGSNGVAAVDAAMDVFNRLPRVSQMSRGLTEFPLHTKRFNGRAAALNIVDLKSVTMSLMMEQLGAASPARWMWTLRDRKVVANNTATNYLVIMRNFDPVTYDPSRYVNGVRYSYQVLEFQNPAFADAVEFVVGTPQVPAYNTVVGIFENLTQSGFAVGEFFSGLTRDDAGALRYIYSPNNYNVEPFQAGTLMFAPNLTNLITITNQDLTLLSLRSLTNNPLQLSNFYPGIVISSAVPRTNSSIIQVQEVLSTNQIAIATFTNTDQLLLVTNIDLAQLTSFSRTSEPPALLSNPLFPGLAIARTNIVGVTTDVQIASIVLTNVGFPLFTNFANLQVVSNQDLFLLTSISRTSAPAALLAAFPGLVITKTNIGVETQAQLVATIITNGPPEPWGDPFQTNFIVRDIFATNLVTVYDYQYANVITNYSSPVTEIRELITGIDTEPWSDPLNPQYKTNVSSSLVNRTSGGFIIVPTTVAGYVFEGSSVSTIITNFATVVSNFFPTPTGATRLVLDLRERFFTNTAYAVFPIELTGAGSAVLVTNFVTNIVRQFAYEYLNVLTNPSPFGVVQPPGLVAPVTFQNLDIIPDIRNPAFPPLTNLTSTTILSNFVNGGAIIVPTNLFGFQFTGVTLTNIIPVTNVLFSAVVNQNGEVRQAQTIYYFTNITYAVYPIQFLPQGFVTNVLVTNLVTNIVGVFDVQFANVLTNYSSPITPATNYTLVITTNVNFPFNVTTNIVAIDPTTVKGPDGTNVPSGGFLIDTNFTGFQFTGIQTTNIQAVTNLLADFVDQNGNHIQEFQVYLFTNVIYAVFPFELVTPPAAVLRPGIDKFNFVKIPTATTLGLIPPYTNKYSAVWFTNGIAQTNIFVEVQTQPDILFGAADLGTVNNDVVPFEIGNALLNSGANFRNNAALNGANTTGGPGTIEGVDSIFFNKIGPSIVNEFPGLTTEVSAGGIFGGFLHLFIWGSFDGSTNEPIVFPKDVTLEQLDLRTLLPIQAP
jgi:hypothetical protein